MNVKGVLKTGAGPSPEELVQASSRRRRIGNHVNGDIMLTGM